MSPTPTERVLIILPGPEPAEAIEKLSQEHKNFEFKFHPASRPSNGAFGLVYDIPKDVWKDVTVLVTINHIPEKLEDAPKLRYIHFASSGINHIAHSSICTDSSIILTSSAGCSSATIAEWVTLTALVHCRRYHLLYEHQKQRLWKHPHDITAGQNIRDLVGLRLGVLGYGSIGRQVARVGVALGLDVIAYTARPKETAAERKDTGFFVTGTGDPDGKLPSAWYSGVEKADIHHFLNQDIDILLVSVPLTKQTQGLIGAAEFEVLSRKGRSPFLSNISRGSIIDQKALRDALECGHLCGAALDVAEPEPLPPDDPLWDAPNIIITPHVSGVSVGYMDRVLSLFGQNLEKMSKGKELFNRVHHDAEY